MFQSPEEELLSTCFQEVTGTAPSSITPVRPHASERRIYRLGNGALKMVGVINQSRAENDAFVSLARHFRSLGLPVPTIHLYRADQGVYLEDDLGDTTLLDYLVSERVRTGEDFPASVAFAYETVLSYLPRFQIEAAATLDFSKLLKPDILFAETMADDMLSFSTELVSRILPDYDTSSLSQDFATLVDYLASARGEHFLYRDFQSRNIMLVDGQPFFIDFQSGLRGPLQYDVVSLLYQSSARIPDGDRNRLLETYLSAAARHAPCDRSDFLRFYPAFIVGRMLQVLGVYGRQGLGSGKEYFAQSIPEALRTLRKNLDSSRMTLKLDRLLACSESLLKSLGA